MGRRLAGGAARQRSHLSAAPSGWVRHGVLAVLTFDGVLSAIVGAFFLPLYVAAIPLPISALISGLVNVALVWTALQWAPTPRLAALPLWAWLVVVVAMTFGGPGGDIVLGGAGLYQLAPVLFVALGAGPPTYLLWRTSKVADI